ncbi:MAG: manganese/iron superoxide dismutase-like protein superoxide dismutase, Fe-Mn family [Candidatus Nomurabacteria bacterium]|nr:manganese/iron superoxide dismutase-like protein superoxide dismutase, Fe-Mn family [Candidatus Nomurabacteria bacterium]
MYIEQQFAIPALNGISEKTIEEHKKLYAGYVKHANLITEHIKELSQDAEKNVYEINELQRRFAFEWGGMRNHEVYFSLLEGGANTDAPTLKAAIEKQWGSFDAWLARFSGIAMTRGIGWAMLYFDTKSGELVNGWVDEQHLGQLVGCVPIVALDMWEHSFVADYQPSGKKQYVTDFLAQMNWAVAEQYYAHQMSGRTTTA